VHKNDHAVYGILNTAKTVDLYIDLESPTPILHFQMQVLDNLTLLLHSGTIILENILTQAKLIPVTISVINKHHLNRLFSRKTWVSWYERKAKPFWILMRREMTGFLDDERTICKQSAPHSR